MGKQIAINTDCMEYMRTLPDKAFDLAIVDPPYGISIHDSGRLKKYNATETRWDDATPGDVYFSELKRIVRTHRGHLRRWHDDVRAGIRRNNMTRSEIVTALRICGSYDVNDCKPCPFRTNTECHIALTTAAADLIENQQRHIDALMKANDSLKDAIARRDKQIEDMKQGMAQLAKAVAVKEEAE